MNKDIDDWLEVENLCQGEAFTLIDDGEVLCCAGIYMMEAHRAIAWSFMSDDLGARFLFVHKAVSRFLDQCDIQRIEMAVVLDFEPGHRWAKMLGFKEEGHMREYFADRQDAILYARIS